MSNNSIVITDINYALALTGNERKVAFFTSKAQQVFL